VSIHASQNVEQMPVVSRKIIWLFARVLMDIQAMLVQAAVNLVPSQLQDTRDHCWQIMQLLLTKL
jgi:hypothetical protein